jgi:hypothetical protein
MDMTDSMIAGNDASHAANLTNPQPIVRAVAACIYWAAMDAIVKNFNNCMGGCLQ